MFANRRFLFAALALMLAVLAVVTPSLVSKAADPTDAAGVITATSGVLTAFPILTIVVTAFAIAGVALYMVRRGKGAAR